MVVSLAAKVTVGALSASVIVTVLDCVPLSVALPPETEEIEIIAVSLLAASKISSAVAVKTDVPVVDPAEIVMEEV